MLIDTSAQPAAPYDWRLAVSIGTVSSPERRAQIEAALGAIAASAPEGPALLTWARGQAGGMIRIDEVTGGSHALQGGGRIGLDFEQIAQLRFYTPTGWQPISLTGTLVHELAHVADTTSLLDGINIIAPMRRLLNQLVVSDALSDETRAKVVWALVGELVPAESIDASTLATQGLPEFDRDAVRQRIAHKLKIDPERFTIAPVAPADLQLYLRRALYESGLLREEKATDYADAFMQKHFTGEPLRHEYRNACRFTGSQLIVAPPVRHECDHAETGLLMQRLLESKMTNLPRMPWSAENAMDAPFKLATCPDATPEKSARVK